MTSDWRPSTWGAEISLEYGKRLQGYKDGQGEVRVYGSNGPVGWTSKSLVEGPGVVLGRKGAYRGVEYVEGPFYVIDTAYYVVPKSDLNMRWLYYAIIYHKLGEIDDGSPIPSTTRAAVYVRDVDVPTKKEQASIAAILGTLDDKIELNRRVNKTLEEIAQAIFKSWFVDFDPVHAKADAKAAGASAEEIELAGMAVIAGKTVAELDQLSEDQRRSLAETAALFPDSFQDSELGEIPEGWKPTKLGEMLDLAYGKALRKSDRNLGPFPVYGSGGITGEHDQPLVAGPGIIVGRKGTVGSLYWEDESFFPIDTVFYVKPLGEFSLEFLYYLLNTLGLDQMNTDAAVPGLNRNNAYRLDISGYPAELVSRFTNFAISLRSMIWRNIREARTLAELRDTLLPKLLSGELVISTDAPQTEEVDN